MTSTHELNSLKDLLIKLYPSATFEYIENPRSEQAKNSLVVRNDHFK